MPGYQFVAGLENRGVEVGVPVIVLVGEGMVAVNVGVLVDVGICVAVEVLVAVDVYVGGTGVGVFLLPPLSPGGQGMAPPAASTQPPPSCACTRV